jgi:hypothetical protein
MMRQPADPPAGQGNGARSGAPEEPPVAQQARFGRLQSVQLRRYWPDEERDFMPWLATEENLTLLGEVIGMNLELLAMEQAIGPFRADIIARDEDVEVIVENQLDATDPSISGS